MLKIKRVHFYGSQCSETSPIVDYANLSPQFSQFLFSHHWRLRVAVWAIVGRQCRLVSVDTARQEPTAADIVDRHGDSAAVKEIE